MFSNYFSELKKTFVYKGRTSRKSFWLFAVIHTILLLSVLGLIFLSDALAKGDTKSIYSTIETISSILLIPLYLFPTLSITTRRFHDLNMSGWHQLYSFLPYIGGLILFIYMCYKSVDENNRYNIVDESAIAL